MKVRNFRHLPAAGEYDYADVEVKTFLSPWDTRRLYKSKYASYWRWLDSGRYCDGFDMGNLAEAAKAKESQPQ